MQKCHFFREQIMNGVDRTVAFVAFTFFLVSNIVWYFTQQLHECNAFILSHTFERKR